MDRLKKARGPLRASSTRTIAEIENEIIQDQPDLMLLQLKREKLDRVLEE